ncbi:hypothetical protein PC39_03502 [Salinisphaera sp. PC39]
MVRDTIAGIGAVAATLVAAPAAGAPPALDFKQVDINDDGRIAPFEARRAGFSDSRFERLDTDGDGVISRLEWRADVRVPADGDPSADPSRI